MPPEVTASLTESLGAQNTFHSETMQPNLFMLAAIRIAFSVFSSPPSCSCALLMVAVFGGDRHEVVTAHTWNI